jgi:beta-fructofuranosidase
MPDQRPRYHVHPPANWSNDPNGPLYWRGRYHLFYQHNPVSVSFGPIHWGHVVSPDLVHWAHLPIALAPTPGSVDAGGCWSGCSVVHKDIPTLIYTGVHGDNHQIGNVCLAMSDEEDLITWRKDPDNPVIPGPPAGMEIREFRDPCVWREDDLWWCVLGGAQGDIGVALLYSSADLRQWQYVGVLCSQQEADGAAPYPRPETDDPPVAAERVWECPQFFALGDRHVLLIALWEKPNRQYTMYYIGTYRDRVFRPETSDRFDLGADFYAPSTMLDPQGRRLVWGWTKEGRNQEALTNAGWAGGLSIPRVLTLRSDRSLGIEPLPELTALRGRHVQLGDLPLEPHVPLHLDGLLGESLEIEARLICSADVVVALRVRCSPGTEEYTEIRFDRRAGRIVVDREQASLDAAAYKGAHGGDLLLGPDEPLSLRIFLDRSIVEVYANGRAALTERIYPTRDDSLGMSLVLESGSAHLISLDAWELGSAGLHGVVG